MQSDDIATLVDLAITQTEGKVDAAIARLTKSCGSQIRFSQSSIDISKRWEEKKLQLFVVLDGTKTGFSETPVASADDVRAVVDDTIEFSKHLPESVFFAGLEESVHEYEIKEGHYDEKIDSFTEKAPEIVNSAIDAALQEGAKRVAGALMFGKIYYHQKSSNGPEGTSRKTHFDLNVRAFQDELDYSGQGLTCGTKPTSSEKDMSDAGHQAGRLSKESIGATQGKPGIYDLVLSPTVGANVVGYIPESANPFLVMVGMSPLGDKMGEQIGPEFLTATDDPTFSGGLGSKAFDFEGTPCKRTDIIDKGVLKAFLHNTSSGRMFETDSTGSSEPLDLGQGVRMLLPSPSNIVFNNGNHSIDELLDVNRPTIYVTCNWYTRWQNYQTGEFSTIPRDAMFLIENGEHKPIKNVRISDNMLRIFANIEAMGNDRKQVYWWEVATPTVIPSLRIKDCRITAATQ
ncbi:MAG: TldD/PmbA family protein [Candidatus Thorarchaeota archaeon]